MPKAFQVEVSAAAERDLFNIGSWIATDSPNRAKLFVDQLAFELLALETFPLRCPLIKETKNARRKYRHLVFGDYRVIFRVERAQVFVLRVIHGSQLLKIPGERPSL